jgi:hypothetical protein
MTVRAGMLRPMAKVSVAKSSLTRFSWKRSSTTSLSTGSRPEWCTATPRCSSGSSPCTCGSSRSSSHRRSIALWKMSLTMARSSAELSSSALICRASVSQLFLPKAKTISGE